MSEPASLWEGFSEIEETVPRSPGEFLSPRTRQLFAWWQKASAGGLPLRQDFDIVEHWELIGHIFLVDVLPDGTFRSRIVGEEAGRLVERGREGRVFGPDEPVENLRRLHVHYRHIVETRQPLRVTGRLLFSDKSDQPFEGLDCPLSDDGRSVTTILGLLDPL